MHTSQRFVRRSTHRTLSLKLRVLCELRVRIFSGGLRTPARLALFRRFRFVVLENRLFLEVAGDQEESNDVYNQQDEE